MGREDVPKNDPLNYLPSALSESEIKSKRDRILHPDKYAPKSTKASESTTDKETLKQEMIDRTQAFNARETAKRMAEGSRTIGVESPDLVALSGERRPGLDAEYKKAEAGTINHLLLSIERLAGMQGEKANKLMSSEGTDSINYRAAVENHELNQDVLSLLAQNKYAGENMKLEDLANQIDADIDFVNEQLGRTENDTRLEGNKKLLEHLRNLIANEQNA